MMSGDRVQEAIDLIAPLREYFADERPTQDSAAADQLLMQLRGKPESNAEAQQQH